MVFPGASREPCSLQHIHPLVVGVELEELIGALSNLSLPVEHEATSKGIDSVHVANRCVALATLDHL